jgi:hypothetical protein
VTRFTLEAPKVVAPPVVKAAPKPEKRKVAYDHLSPPNAKLTFTEAI